MTGTVEVLLSTFNAGGFLSQQLESVWAQDYPDVSVVVRDDGSADGTVEQIEGHLSGRTNARFIVGEHLGAGRSFLALLSAIGPEARYAAFCDQDDVWLPGKVRAAVAALEHLSGPSLYCSAVELVDRDLKRIRTHRRCVRGPSFDNALVENIATGCTIVLNRAAVDLLSAKDPHDFLMHDAWCYLVIAGCGQVIYDSQPYVLYRQHSSNTIGVAHTFGSEWTRRARQHLSTGHKRVLTAQANELKSLYWPELLPDAARSLTQFLLAETSVSRRLQYAMSGSAYRQRRLDDWIYRALYAAHRI